MVNFHSMSLSQTSCYLLKAKDGYLLIDCGNLHDKKAFLNNIRKFGIAITDIRYLFLTHHHNDHCGLITFLISANPKIQVIMSRKCSEYLKTGNHFKHINEHYSNTMLRHIVNTYSRLRKHSESFDPYFRRDEDIILDYDNDIILPELGIDGKILFVPGHTEDSISIVADKAAFVGDTARNMMNFTGTPYQPILLYDLEACYKSWNKLIEAGAKIIYPGHGSPFIAENIQNNSKNINSI